MTAAASQCATDRAGRGVNGAHGDHCLREHGATGVSDVQAKAGQKAVNFLRYFQKGNGAQKPYQYIAGDSFFPGSADRGFYVALGNSKCAG